MAKNHKFILGCLISLTAVALFVQLYLLLTHHHVLTNYISVSVYEGVLALPRILWLYGLLFFGAVILVYSVCTSAVYVVSMQCADHFHLKPKNYLMFGLLVWWLTASIILLANQVLFPASFYSHYIGLYLPHKLSLVLLIVFSLVMLFFICVAFFRSATWLKLSITLVTLVCGGLWGASSIAMHQGSSTSKPNVIVVGVDSLRPDYVKPQLMPFVSGWVSKSVDFTQAYTPLARTFPSYAALLTGMYPLQNGINFNFQDSTHAHISNSLVNEFKKEGYVTYYSTDDSQYTDIDSRYGFDYIDANGTSILNYIFAQFSDFPLFNLIANTRVGYWLFPYTYNNRNAAVTYQPERYVQQVLSDEGHLPNGSVLMVVHFCLPHYPYTWSASVFSDEHSDAYLYRQAVQRTDFQIKHYFNGLKKLGFLKHAVVIFLSDHGETLMQGHDRLIAKNNYLGLGNFNSTVSEYGKDRVSYSYGHGTDVLSLQQTHSVLAWRAYGLDEHPVAHQVSQRVSLLDIKPTLLNLLHLPSHNTAESFSLLPSFRFKALPKHPFLLFETGYNPAGLYSPPFTASALLTEVMPLLEISKRNLSIAFKPSVYSRMLMSKQRAVWYRNWYLARLPDYEKPPVFVLVNTKTRQWTDNLTSVFAQQAPLPKLRQYLNVALMPTQYAHAPLH